MEETARLFNLKLEPRDRAQLNAVAETTGTSMSRVMLDSVHGVAKLLVAASGQTFESMQTLRDRIGEDGNATITVVEGPQGQPVAHLVMGITDENPNIVGLKAVAHVIDGNRCDIFLEIEPELSPAPVVFKVGEVSLRVGSVQVRVGEVPWPPTKQAESPFPHSREAIHLDFESFKLPDNIFGDESEVPEAAAKPAKRRSKPAAETT